MKSVLANLGFVLQTAGLIVLLAVPVAIISNEQASLISFLMTSVAFLGSGFLLNSLSQRKMLDFRAACVVTTIVFLLLGIIGSIPYLYTNTFAEYPPASRAVNSFFESVSGYTTTGLTFVTDPGVLPKSIAFYRGLTQWVGGISVVFVLLTFFCSEKVLASIARAAGIASVASSLRKSYIRVFLIYAAYTVIFAGAFYLSGLKDIATNLSLVFGTVATGGFSPVADLSGLASFPNNILLIALMILGGVGFNLHHAWFTGKFGRTLSAEFLAFLLIIGASAIFLSSLARIDLSTAFFHAASASSTTGYAFVDLSHQAESAKVWLIIVMFVGGSTFSTAGGVKVMRVLMSLRSIPWVTRSAVTGDLEAFRFEGKEVKHADIASCWLVVMSAVFIILAAAFIFTLSGFPFTDSLFEATSAFSTTGLSVGIASVALPDALKIVLALLMLLGRIELVPFLVAITPKAGR